MERFTRDGLVFEVADGGPADARVAALLLHGFPQDATAWAGVVPALHAAGLRTLAPHQRGYSPGARPGGRRAYRLEELAADAIALLDAAGVERAHVVGHDWGAGVAWALAAWHHERVASLVALSTPHPAAFTRAMLGSQAFRSWYMLAFQLPVLPERAVAGRIGDFYRSTDLPEEHVERYAGRFSRPGELNGPLNWYRALPFGRRGVGRIRVPTTYVWGRRDPALGRAAAERTAENVVGDYRFVELDAGHWLPETHPETVAREILQRVDVRVALARGATAVADLGDLPEEWLVRETLPQVTLLAHAALAVSHGGNNSVTEALTAGVPLVLLPFSTDQFAGAAAIEDAGLGEALDPNVAAPSDLRAAAERVLALGGEPRARLRALVQADPGPLVARRTLAAG